MEVKDMRNRKRQREIRKQKKEFVGKYIYSGIKDLTCYNADRLMQGGKIDDIVYK